MKLFIAPHNDDETLFGAFTILREAAEITVAVVYDSFVQPSRGHIHADMLTRRGETVAALEELLGKGTNRYNFCGVSDLDVSVAGVELALRALRAYENKHKRITDVFLPAFAAEGHQQHNLVNQLGREVFDDGERLIYEYTTYTGGRRQTSAHPVAIQHEWVAKKLRALACYTSQHEIDNCRPHFLGAIDEFYL